MNPPTSHEHHRPDPPTSIFGTLRFDLLAGLVVFLVALPLCLGVALASNAPLFSGVITGIVGGVLVGFLSGSQTSVAGPAAGLTAIVAAEIASLGSFEAFLVAVMLAGVIQIALGIARAGFVAAFIPSSVIKGLLAAIGVILILKQIPHLAGHDTDPEGELAFYQPDHENTFSELLALFSDIHVGALFIGLISIALLVLWDRVKPLKKSGIPAPLVVVIVGIGMSLLMDRWGAPWHLQSNHLVEVPVADRVFGIVDFLSRPDLTQWNNPKVYSAALTIAFVASLETLLNLEAVDKLDPQQRTSPPSRELVAQGVGNIVAGFLGGIPMTSVIVRSSVNINAGGRTRLSAVIHGFLLLGSVMLLPTWLNMIPLASLAAILLVTGVKLASPALVRQMWNAGGSQFLPFATTVVAIVFSDLLIGVLIGLGVSIGFILRSNLRRPMRRIVEQHRGGDVLHVELANQVTFLNRAALTQILDEVPPGGHILLDAQDTDYVDPDILDLIRDFKQDTAPARGIAVSLLGFREDYRLDDQIEYIDYCTRELQSALTPAQALEILRDGHARFLEGRRLMRDLARQVSSTAPAQHPLAVVVSCIDSRVPVELIFDVGLGDIFSVRIAGNVTSPKVIGSVEYATAVAGAKLILVMGHSRCGAVTTAIRTATMTDPLSAVKGCEHVEAILNDIHESVDRMAARHMDSWPEDEREAFTNRVASANVQRTVEVLRTSRALAARIRDGHLAIVGAMYDVVTGKITYVSDLPETPAEAETSSQKVIKTRK